ncbi:MAG: lipopolysaccharide kinase InaA family protein [bacterium]
MEPVESPPAGFRLVREDGAIGWIRDGFDFLLADGGRSGRVEPWPRPARPDPSSSRLEDAGPYRGRGEVVRVPIPASPGEHALVRHYRRGGLVRHLLSDQYPGRERFFREVRTTERARSLGIPAPEVLGVRAERIGWGFYRGDLMTRQIPGSRDLGEYLEGCLGSSRKPQGPSRDEILTAVAGLLRCMHDRGLVHADLNVKNVLLRFRAGAVDAFIIDLDRARLGAPVCKALRVQNLERLYRSLEKQGLLGPVVTDRDVSSFIGAYALEDSGLESRLLQRLRRGSGTLRWHHFWWRLAGGSGKRSGT